MDPLIIDPLVIDSNIEIYRKKKKIEPSEKKKNVLGKCCHLSWLKSLLMFCDCWFQIPENHQRHVASPVLVQNHPPNSWDIERPKNLMVHHHYYTLLVLNVGNEEMIHNN